MHATVSPPTSSELTDAAGEPWSTPVEWRRGYLHVRVPVEAADEVEVVRNGAPLLVAARRVGDRFGVVAEWAVAGPGFYDITVYRAGEVIDSSRYRVGPSKFSEAALASMLADLEASLPATVAIALHDTGSRIDITRIPAGEHTLATEIARLRRAVFGNDRPGLVSVLTAMAPAPHGMLIDVGMWVRRHHARRVDPTRLPSALWRADNVEGGLPRVLVDHRVQHTVDLYENRIVRSFHDSVASRLLRLQATAREAEGGSPLAEELEEMVGALKRARRGAAFLDEVRPLSQPPDRVTMVLLRRPEYRAAYEGYQAFRSRPSVTLREPALHEPLANLPYLYQVWCSLQVIENTARCAALLGFRVQEQRIVTPTRDGLVVEVLAANRPALRFAHPNGSTLTLTHERRFSAGGRGLHSVSYTQVPDLSLELVSPSGDTSVLLLDPKYKLQSEEVGEPSDGTPQKVDIDKMHAYRDAIRGRDGRRVVSYAATLYPGRTMRYGHDLAAIQAVPGHPESLGPEVIEVITRWLARKTTEWGTAR